MRRSPFAGGGAFVIPEDKLMETETMPTLRRLWNRLFDRLMGAADVDARAKQRAISWNRISDQVWALLALADEVEGTYTWPLDYYVDDDGRLFLLASRDGKLYRIGLIMRGDDVLLGDWVRVMETFQAVQQARMTVMRQADGRYRWLMIAGTSVINRVGEIDSRALFDSFVRRAEETGKYPRLDFYHMGAQDPEQWEFGTADYLAREGVTYLASGLFDEEHPLAQATIRAAAAQPGKWGASIEFYAAQEPEYLLAEPELVVPVYKDGENTRISVVLEFEAAGWFTRLGVQEVIAMDERIRDRLRELLGDTPDAEETLAAFEANVDAVNQRVADDKLIHRSTEADAPVAEAQADAEEDDEDGDEPETVPAVGAPADEGETAEPEMVLDDEAVDAIAQAMMRTDAIQTLLETALAAQAQAQSLEGRVGLLLDTLSAVQAANQKLAQRVAQLERSDEDKQSGWLADLPAATRAIKVTHRPRNAEADVADSAGEDYGVRAQETLERLPKW